MRSPRRVALLASGVGVVIVAARLVLAAHGQVSDFVVAGRYFANPKLVPRGLRVFPGTGYDGQFFYRISLDPVDFARRAFGVRIDASYRFQRIGYPVLAWLGSLGGHPSLVPWSLIAVNLIAIGVVGFAASVLASQAGRHPAWGLLMVGFFGFPFTLSRDTAEIVTAAFTLAGIVALRGRRYVIAAAALSAAVLTRETVVLVVFAYGVVRIVEVVRRKRSLGAPDLAWVVPGVAFVGWQAVVSAFSSTPAVSDLSANLSIPFVAMVQAQAHWIAALPVAAADLWVEQAAVLIFVVAMGVVGLRGSSAGAHERLAFVLLAALSASLAYGIWGGQADFRSFSELYLFAVLVVIEVRRRRNLWVIAAPVALAWLPVVVHQVAFI